MNEDYLELIRQKAMESVERSKLLTGQCGLRLKLLNVEGDNRVFYREDIQRFVDTYGSLREALTLSRLLKELSGLDRDIEIYNNVEKSTKTIESILFGFLNKINEEDSNTKSN